MPEEDKTGSAGEKTFTQAELDAVVRERLKRERDKYADYDDLRAKAGEADRNKSALDQVLEKVAGLERRAADADERAVRLEVAQAKGLTPNQAKRLQGKTREELEADADELLAMFQPAKDGTDGKDGDGKDGAADGGDGKDGESGTDGAGDKNTTDSGSTKDGGGGGGAGDGEGRKLPPAGRPKETLTSGAVPATGGGGKSAAELAESILKADF